MFNRCLELFEAMAGWSLLDALGDDEASSRVGDTEVAQPGNFIVQVSLTELLRSWGVRPAAIVGHSAGEPAAAYAAGVLSLEEAIRVIYHRSRLQQGITGQGGLVAVGLSLEETLEQVRALGSSSLSLAAINSPSSVTVVGSDEDVRRLHAHLERQGVFARILRVTVPYHSVFMDPLRAELLTELDDLIVVEADVPLYSTVDGGRVTGLELDAGYWFRNVREPVRFINAIKAILEDGHRHFIELAPHPVLSGAVREIASTTTDAVEVESTLHRNRSESESMRRLLTHLHVWGLPVDWRAAQGAGAWMRLPTYPWSDTRYWSETLSSQYKRSASVEHPLLASRIDDFFPAWEVDLDAACLWFLEDHRIQGSVVFPGAGYLEMATHAAKSLYGGTDTFELDGVEFVSALYLAPDQPVTLRLEIQPADHSFVISSRAYGNQQAVWQVHCTGRMRLSRMSAPCVAEIEQIQSACPAKVERDACYRFLRSIGLEYGPSFQGISRLWQGQMQALSHVVVPAEVVAGMDTFNLHPAVLDVCLQTVATALPMNQENEAVFLPVGVGTLRIHRPLSDRLWLHARISRDGEQELNGDLLAYDEQGRCILEMRNCRVRALADDRAGFIGAPQKLFQPDWMARVRDIGKAKIRKGVWLVYGGRRDLCRQVLKALEEIDCLAFAVVDANENEQVPGAWRVSSEDDGDWQRILEQARLLAGAAKQTVCGVIHLGLSHVGELPIVTPEQCDASYEQALHQGCLVTLALSRALARYDAADRPRLWIVTRDTQPVAGQEVANPMHAAVWGMARVIGRAEHIEIWGGLIDLPGQASADEANWVVQDCVLCDGEDEIGWRDAQRYVRRLHECPRSVSLPVTPVFRGNATYLITGGLGALGLVVARWMVRNGARHLLLLSRGGLPPREQWLDSEQSVTVRRRIAEVLAIESAGGSVRIESVDVTDRDALHALLARHAQGGYPSIRGVIHAAGSTHPMLMEQLTAGELETTLAVKLRGAWNIHHALADKQLDFFMLFSSAASLVVTAGQSAYAAANAALDSLAHYRFNRGLPATSINWGPWGDVGMAKELNLIGLFNRRGLLAMNSAQGCQKLGELMSGHCAQAMVLGVNWETVAETSPLGIPAPAIEHVLRDEMQSENYVSSDDDANEISFVERYRNCVGDQERFALVLAELRNHIGKVMRIDGATLNDKTPLISYGMDSMMAIELRHRVERLMQVQVAIVDILKSTGTEHLARLLESELRTFLVSEDEELLDIVDAMKDMSEGEIRVLMGDEANREAVQ
jgi:acyl transferase domain-containing protein/aryl carrier-like protein